MSKHITKAWRTAFFHLHNIAKIKKYLSEDVVCVLSMPILLFNSAITVIA